MNTLFNQPLKVVNAGLHSFADNIQHAGGSAIALNWQPPAQGDIDAGLDLASLLRHPPVENANQIAMTRYLEAQPMLVDVMLAKEAIPAMAEQKTYFALWPADCPGRDVWSGKRGRLLVPCCTKVGPPASKTLKTR